uniref:Phosphatidic acid phosphatase type 2/haloperoxidase domain-containing protein n=1 Tax=Chromera velia CCMP2878 TaxID=1169474 RepID=A0A0G4HH25_9ALVE|eukprot:Cvel_6829.t1-p1 / transcript=Cvel_6829.t1 / gene=Cvel_6829 / organism=Chromera_velia_CCMP2878 / gene_product=Dolichyldiphosphatase, putative / transcript_product=Dolichyldiphosphatase, putative / location=Cvel_scaffold344:81501-83819(+) / protein_length=248 / sequence_SO=supercontig / SO=protein_coding / is_pseudo=false
MKLLKFALKMASSSSSDPMKSSEPQPMDIDESTGLITATAVGKKREQPLYDVDLEAGIPEPSKTTAYACFSVTIRRPVTPLSAVAVAYSFLPYLVCLSFFVWFFLREQIYPLWGLATFLMISVICEVCFKNIFKEPRPENSAVRSYGMPSSHSATCVAVLVWTFLEFLVPLDGISPPLSAGAKAGILCLTTALMLPIPWARWYIEDHSLKQVLVGSALGVFFGALGFWARVSLLSGMPVTAPISSAMA